MTPGCHAYRTAAGTIRSEVSADASELSALNCRRYCLFLFFFLVSLTAGSSNSPSWKSPKLFLPPGVLMGTLSFVASHPTDKRGLVALL